MRRTVKGELTLGETMVAIGGVGVLLATLIPLLPGVLEVFVGKTVVGTVTEKNVDDTIGGEVYLVTVLSPDKEHETTYEIVNSMHRHNLNAEDLFDSLEEGKQYEIEVRGCRMTWLGGSLPNIYQATEI